MELHTALPDLRQSSILRELTKFDTVQRSHDWLKREHLKLSGWRPRRSPRANPRTDLDAEEGRAAEQVIASGTGPDPH
jgi:hypothetical protein